MRNYIHGELSEWSKVQHSKCCVRNVPRVRIPNSPPKWKAGRKACFLLWQNKKRNSNKEGADAVCGRKQSGGLFLPTGSRSEGAQECTEKIPNSPSRSAVVHDTMGYRTFLFFCRESPHWNNTKSIRDAKQDYIFCWFRHIGKSGHTILCIHKIGNKY